MDLLTIIICSSLPLLITADECQNYTTLPENIVFNSTQSLPRVLSQLSTIPVLVSLVTIPVPYFLFSMKIGIRIPDDLDPETNVSCALIWLGQDGAPVRVSNVIHSPGGTADTLTIIHPQQNDSVCDNKTVTGALLVGENSCGITKDINNTINAIVLNNTAININNLTQFLSRFNANNEIETLIRSTLMVENTTLQPLVIILIATSVPASLLLCITLTILCIMFCSRSKKISTSHSQQLDNLNRPLLSNSKSCSDVQSSMVPNLLYNHEGMIQQTQVVRKVTDIEHSIHSTSHSNVTHKTDKNVLEWTREAKIRRKQRAQYTFRPTFGIMAPAVDFALYNLQRTDDWKYDRSNLVYLREIGEGQFGKVLLMKAKNIAGFKGRLPVAVKTLTSTSQQDVKNFTEEVELMKRFCHQNIVSLLGVSFHNEGAPLMILEYMPYGDLQGFLEKQRHTQLVHLGHLLSFAKDVAQALSFLEFKKYIHRDVAARNCLVGPCLEAKLADFGMARRVGQDWYVASGPGLFPVRWTAPESLTQRVYTSASDVWSYGVLLWEITTFGQLPLSGLDSQEIIDKAHEETLHHTWPPASYMPLQNLAMQCHNLNPKARPTFSQILAIIQEIITAH